jgi:hypothetical protein
MVIKITKTVHNYNNLRGIGFQAIDKNMIYFITKKSYTLVIYYEQIT